MIVQTWNTQIESHKIDLSAERLTDTAAKWNRFILELRVSA